MNRFSKLFLLALSSLAVSCVGEVLHGPSTNHAVDRSDFVPVEYKAVIEQIDVDTKTVMSGDVTDNLRKILWEPGDKILLTSDYHSPYGVLENVSSESGENAVFKGLYNNSNFVAIYPSSIVDTSRVYRQDWSEDETSEDRDYLYLNLPSVQKYQENGVASGTLPMYAWGGDISSDGSGSLVFRNLCSVLVLKLRSDVSGLRVNNIRLKAKAGNSTYQRLSGLFRTWRNSFPMNLQVTDDGLDYVDLDCIDDNGQGVDINKSEPVYFHIVIPCYSSYNGFEIEVHTNKGRAVSSSKHGWVNLERGKRYFTANSVPLEFVIDDLSVEETANSYIVPEVGQYKFKATVKGNSSEQIDPKGAVVLWESYGKGTAPSTGDIISDVSLKEGYIHFTALREGNAVIAAIDDAQKVLWSWHIWSTDGYDPIATQNVYNNGAGIFMDRNLGAVSSVPGDSGAKGLFYQWGRKDPFTTAETTMGTWQSKASSAEYGTVGYAVSNPTTFILGNDANYDWYYTGSSDTDNTRWGATKSMYDPCPAGWQVPAAVWSTAMGATESNSPELWDSGDAGMNLSSKFGGNQVWYPASGAMDYQYLGMYREGQAGYYWSSTPSGEMASSLTFNSGGTINTMYNGVRAYGMNVRCCRSDFSLPVDASQAEDLSRYESANSYLITAHGKQYKFKSTKQGNSSDAIVGEPYKAEVVWETFGTDEKPNKGDVVTEVCLSSDGYIVFTSGSKDGNALIALKDMNNRILWSWHIWSVAGYDAEASSQQYRNSAIMMDRNLGALAEVSNDSRDFGLLYQWGRKDPFLSANRIPGTERVASTCAWPSAVSSNAERGTLVYAIANPTTFITTNSYSTGWLYADENSMDNTLWGDVKTKYDPCPPGWIVPKGGSDGVWASAFHSDAYVNVGSSHHNYATESGDFSSFYGTNVPTWYPRTPYLWCDNGSYSGGDIFMTSSTVDNSVGSWERRYIRGLSAGIAHISANDGRNRADGLSVRCMKEYSMPSPRTYSSLSAHETANSYIVPEKGRRYSFNAIARGNGSSSVQNYGQYAKILWESNGTASTTREGDVIKDVEFKKGEIRFTSVGNGNAVIALMSNDRVEWSWHVWVSEGYDPEASAQNYANAGFVMDRNLGAMSATKGDAKSFGLLYQWGRKDPFFGSVSVDGTSAVSSSVEWPSAVDASATRYDEYNGDGSGYGNMYINSVDYAQSYPMRFIKPSGSDNDWYVVHDPGVYENESDYKERWKRAKTIYDPCPPGWRVMEGGEASLWSAAGVSFGAYDSVSKGYSVNSSYWYPMPPVRSETSGDLSAASGSLYWAAPSSEGKPYYMQLTDSNVELNGTSVSKGRAGAVRCCKIGFVPEPESSAAVNLSKKGTANSYIANTKGTTYQFYAKVRGNSEESVGSPVKAEVLWETFGTSEKPNPGGVVSEVSYNNGFVTFKAGNDGNAVIAVKEASDNILWSWHIWVCNGYDPDATAHTYNNGAGVFMDRNLGALSATPGDKKSYGLFYQWGRKDPFVYFRSSENGYEDAVAFATATGVSFDVVNADTEHWSDYSFSHPTSYISGTLPDQSMLGRDRKWTLKKSEYDPCPPGWHVPGRNDNGSSCFSMAAGRNDVIGIKFWDGNNSGWNMGALFADGIDVWFPASGNLGTSASYNNREWSGSVWMSSSSNVNMWMPDFSLYGGPNTLYFNNTAPIDDGLQVRCMKE